MYPLPAKGGVFERFPRLLGASVELGAAWAAPLLERLDDVVAVFGRGEPDLRALRRKPSEMLREQFAFTPFVFEDVGRMIRRSGPELYLFSTDYPHTEGGRNPLGRFEASLADIPGEAQSRFYAGNFERIFGAAAQRQGEQGLDPVAYGPR